MTFFLTFNIIALDFCNIQQLVADTFRCTIDLAAPFAKIVHQKTKGNPFFANRFLKGLYESNWITFNTEARHWQCDIVQIRQLALTDNVVTFMTQQLQKLSTATQTTLMLAACIGNQFDLYTLANISEQSPEETAASLWKALQEGLILPTKDIHRFYQVDTNELQTQTIDSDPALDNCAYRFLHDRVQKAAYSLIPNDQIPITHLTIGKLLLKHTKPEKLKDNIFDIVNQMNLGIDLIQSASDKGQLVELNFIAGKRAKTSAAYAAACGYMDMARRLLPLDHWQNDYKSTLSLYNLAIETAYLSGDFAKAENLISLLLENANNELDKVKAYEVKIQLLISENKLLDSIHIARNILHRLGVSLPGNPDDVDIDSSLNKVAQKLSASQIDTLLELPIMEDRTALACMRILSGILNAAYLGLPNLLPIIVAKQVDLSITHGNMAVSPSAYANYGLILCGVLDEIELGYHYGLLALKLSQKIDSKEFYAKTAEIVCLSVKHWKEHLCSTFEILLDAYRVGLESGDFESASFAAYDYCAHSFVSGKNLADLEREMYGYSLAISEFQQRMVFRLNELHRQTVLNLLTMQNNSFSLTGTAYDEREMLPIHQQDSDFSSLALMYIDKLFLCCIFGDSCQAVDISSQAEPYLDGLPGQVFIPLFYFYDALAWLDLYFNLNEEEQKKATSRVLTAQSKMEHWANYAEMNYAHKLYLIRAEYHRVLDDKLVAIEMYDLAIAGAKENNYIQEEALANERAAKFYRDWGKEKVAAGYMQEAYYCYSRWGAKAKVTDLEILYPELLQPILQPSATSGDVMNMLMTIAAPTVSVYAGTPQNSSNKILDFASILKASQALSGTIELDDLLRQLTQIILQNSGGDRCALILPTEQGEWQVRAIATPKESQLFTEPLADNPNLPVKLIQYVKNTQEVVVIDDGETDLPVIGHYLNRHQPKSLLCTPILQQSQFVGILYLENQVTTGAFTGDRLELLNILCTQAAISIRNSLLHQERERSLQDAQHKSQGLAEAVALSNGQQQILALIAQGVPLETVLAETARHIESQSHHPAYCSFLRLDGQQLRNIAAPSLPAAYNSLVDGLHIGPAVGSCGTAAYRKASITVNNIATDPLWANYQIALEFGLQACASTPILGAEGQVLATLAMYQPKPGTFTQHDRQLMEAATYLARIAIERDQADTALQQLNLQMVQGEKMASLGNLVAGVAHEINNPIGFLNGSNKNTRDYVQDLLGHLALYQRHYPEPVEDIQINAEEIDLDFLGEDLPKLLNSIQGATDRIKLISTSLRTFSRADTEHKVSADLHKGLDSTLLILKYRLKANKYRPEIQVLKNYGELPDIECFPGQLNQVFMNVLANAIDMFDEAAQQSSFTALEEQVQKITIKSALIENNCVEIRIRDNGKGISDDVANRIFDHLFTTKNVGKGTGLGLAIAKQIIVETHGGTLEVQSEIGQGTEFCLRLPIA